MAALLFLHGIGGPLPHSDWLTPLNHELGVLGHMPIQPGAVIDPAYDDLLKGAQIPRSKALSRALDPREGVGNEADRDDFEYRRQQVSSRLKPVAGVTSVLTSLPEGDYMANRMPQVRAYMDDRVVRQAVWRRILAALGEERELVVVGHSLGSAIAVDLLAYLDPSTEVLGLVTLGSPLGAVPGLRQRLGWVQRSFPYGRVGTWVNIFDPRDPVSAGRGVGHHFAPAVDVPVTINRHAALAYCNHPATATAVGFALQRSRPTEAAGAPQLRPVPKAWWAILLRFGFAQQLANAVPPTEARRRQRLTLARHEVARRADELARRTVRTVEAISPGSADQARHVAPHCLRVLESAPNEQELVHHSLALLGGRLDRQDLLVAGVSLLVGRPLPPFEIDSTPALRRQALQQVFLRVQADGESDPDGAQLLDAVTNALVAASKEIVKVPRPMSPGAPLGLIATTTTAGVGTVEGWPTTAAAAVLQATQLAAQGPDGLASGMVALALLTRGSDSSIAHAAMRGSSEEGWPTAPDGLADVLIQHAVDQGTVEELQVTLTAMLAVVMAQESLRLPSSRTVIRQAVLVMLSEARDELAVHDRVAPSTRTTRSWRTKVRLLERAERWLEARDVVSSYL